MWTIFVLLILGILFPLTQILNIFYAGSVMEMVDRSVITSSIVIVVVKAINLYATRKGLNELFYVIKGLDGEIHDECHILYMNATIKLGHQLYFTYLCPYISTCVLLLFQTIFSMPENRMWSSTYGYPFEWAHNEYIYLGRFICSRNCKHLHRNFCGCSRYLWCDFDSHFFNAY